MSPKKAHFEIVIDQELNKKEARLSSLITEKIKLVAEIEMLRKSRELFTQSRKRQKVEKIK